MLRAAVFISTLITLFLLGVVHAIFTAVSFTVGVTTEAHTYMHCNESPTPTMGERQGAESSWPKAPLFTHFVKGRAGPSEVGSLSPTNSRVCRIGKQHGLPQVLLMLHTEDDSWRHALHGSVARMGPCGSIPSPCSPADTGRRAEGAICGGGCGGHRCRTEALAGLCKPRRCGCSFGEGRGCETGQMRCGGWSEGGRGECGKRG